MYLVIITCRGYRRTDRAPDDGTDRQTCRKCTMQEDRRHAARATFWATSACQSQKIPHAHESGRGMAREKRHRVHRGCACRASGSSCLCWQTWVGRKLASSQDGICMFRCSVLPRAGECVVIVAATCRTDGWSEIEGLFVTDW